MKEKRCWQDHEEAGHIAATVKKQREVNISAHASSSSVWDSKLQHTPSGRLFAAQVNRSGSILRDTPRGIVMVFAEIRQADSEEEPPHCVRFSCYWFVVKFTKSYL